MKIYVEFKKPKTLREFLQKFFSGHVGLFGGCSVDTYNDEKCTQLQCAAGRARSIQDLSDCVNTYFPDTPIETIVKELLTLRPYGRNFTPYRCSTIRRPVVRFSSPGFYGKLEHFPRNSQVEWSWGRLLRSAGVNNLEKLYPYED